MIRKRAPIIVAAAAVALPLVMGSGDDAERGLQHFLLTQPPLPLPCSLAALLSYPSSEQYAHSNDGAQRSAEKTRRALEECRWCRRGTAFVVLSWSISEYHSRCTWQCDQK